MNFAMIAVGVIFGFFAWFIVRYIIAGIYTVDQNERAVKTVFGRAQRIGTATTLDDPISEGLKGDERDRYIFPQVRVIPPGGPYFKFTEAISFVVNCEDQKEVDYFWSKLSAGGEESRCGWLKDKFGLSWQIVPTVLIEMLADKDVAKAKRVTHAMLQMDKIDIPTLQKAYDGK